MTQRFFAVILLLVLGPLLITIAFIIRWRLGTPIFFRQARPGLHGVPFQLLKFRTMLQVTNIQGLPLPDAERMTKFGHFLRSSSLDELPELINIIRGEMAFVGPRPLLMEYLPLYTPRQMRRHEVLPGITGWAQINGRNAISWEDKFNLDVWYVDHKSFLFDLRILVMTIWKVLRREGVSAAGEATVTKFVGNAKSDNFGKP